MAAFLTPIEEIFAFLEDTMMVKVSYAIGSGRKKLLNQLFNIGVIGGGFSALAALALCLVISESDVAASFILNPSSGPNQVLLSDGCDLIPDTAEMLSVARPYWIILAASFLPKLVNKTFLGLMMASGAMVGYLIPLVAQATFPVVLWFCFKEAALGGTLLGGSVRPLALLGISYGSADWFSLVGFILLFSLDVGGLSSQHGLRLYCFSGWAQGEGEQQPLLLGHGSDEEEAATATATVSVGERKEIDGDGDANDEDADNPSFYDTARRMARDGLELMVVDLAVQLSLTLSIYLAATRSMEMAYKLAAAQSAYWMFGPSYFVGFSMTYKFIGARQIAEGKFRAFLNIFRFMLVLTAFVSVGAMIAAFMYAVDVSADYGESACIFATDRGCARASARIFGAEDDRGRELAAGIHSDSLSDVFKYAFGPTVGMQMVFIMFRTTLATLHDFKFMALASSSTFVLVYVPAALVARFVFDSVSTGKVQ